MNILTKVQAVSADKYAMDNCGVPSAILMENAARSAFEILSEKISKDSKICILCGSGNNGGDGFALARHLIANGYCRTTVFSIADKSKMSDESLNNYQICLNLEIPLFYFYNLDEFYGLDKDFDCYVEALTGIGGDENLREFLSSLLKIINGRKGFKAALDLPAGLNPDTGKAHPDAFKADLTISMFAPKLGMYLNNGRNLCGEIRTASLGVPQEIIGKFSTINIYRNEDIRIILKIRDSSTSKFDFGKVLIIAGSAAYPGAAALTANAAVRGGAGLVHLASTEFLPALFPEVIRINLERNSDGTINKSNRLKLHDSIQKADAIAIGPGIGDNKETLDMIMALIREFPDKKFVIDADGLKCLSADKLLNQNIVLTPHLYEFARLIGKTPEDISGREYELTNEYAKRLNCVLHLKSVPSITSNGQLTALCTNGKPGMATGGSGDVLTGIISAYLGMGIAPFEAASLGAFIHSKAGDLYTKSHSQESLKAGDLIEFLKYVLD